ncbi:hypothetical protein V8D89_006631 [Ganoderma adspersum]
MCTPRAIQEDVSNYPSMRREFTVSREPTREDIANNMASQGGGIQQHAPGRSGDDTKEIIMVIKSVKKLSNAIKTIKSDISGIPEIKANMADLLCHISEMDHNVKNAQAMRDDVVGLSNIIKDQNEEICSAQKCMLILANEVENLRNQVTCHKRNKQCFRTHENSRFSFIERMLNLIMTHLHIPQPQPDDR